MSTNLPKPLQETVRKAIYDKADRFGYCSRTRTENSTFMDQLLDAPDVGGVLVEYMERDKIRTYIKDAVLNRYAKEYKKRALIKHQPEAIIKNVYNVDAGVIDTAGNVKVLSSEGKELYVISEGTVVKWETALRKAMEYIAKMPDNTIETTRINICLKLFISNKGMAESEKKHLRRTVKMLGVETFFVDA